VTRDGLADVAFSGAAWWRRGALSLLVGGAIGIAGSAVWKVKYRLDRASQFATEVLNRRLLVGRSFAMPSGLDSTIRLRLPDWNSEQPLALLIIRSGTCLACFEELERWKKLAVGPGHLPVVAIVVGAMPEFTEKVWQEEHLPFPLIADPEGAVPLALGIQLKGTMRILLLDRRIALAVDGSDAGPIGFPEALKVLASPEPIVVGRVTTAGRGRSVAALGKQ
jgi:hypothetical protein